jgi:hypothetical protein
MNDYIGCDLHLDRLQADYLHVDYIQEGSSLIVAAEKLLVTRNNISRQQFDRDHEDMLRNLGTYTLVLKGIGNGWFEITGVF